MPGIETSTVWKTLATHADRMKRVHLRDLLTDAARNSALTVNANGILFDYSRQNVNIETMDFLMDLADAAMLEQKRAAMYAGEKINTTEGRAVLHVALRAARSAEIMVDGVNQVPLVYEVLDHIKDFSARVLSNKFVGATGKPLKNVISIGIGGSYLGPEFVHEAIKCVPQAAEVAKGRTLRFLANVDPVDVARATQGLDPEETLVVVVSKTFTTAETMLNARTLRKWLLEGIKGTAPEDVIRQHMVAASSAVPLVTDFGVDPANIFGFWDWVGGRYSVCSAVGVLPLALVFGFEVLEQFLAGARNIDEHFATAPLRENIPVLMGLLGVWNSTFLGHESRAILPYAQALLRFPAHVQQLDMESNGKRVGIDGRELPFQAGEVNFGEPGTNGQHSFYQLIHQGRTIPTEFIGFARSQQPIELPDEMVSGQDELMSNFFAQPDALALGKTRDQLQVENVAEDLRPHKEFPGNRPSFSLLFGQLDPFTTGQLLALYEHRVFVQGAIWGINSFDQWGVELGKVLAKQVRTQLAASRQGEATISGFNSSTAAMIRFYLLNSTSGSISSNSRS
ncbi:hypothetical protein VYU27_003179 [Nannochloropsis oceanica]